MHEIINISGLNKVYAGGFQALNDVNLSIKRGEIFALLGPNGAGKTSLISMICGLSTITAGSIKVGGYDILRDYRRTRSMIGLVPQELTTDAFESVWNTVCFSRGLFGKQPNPKLVSDILKKLSLWEKRHDRLMTLSGGMKRRLIIAKALAHEPEILFLDEPTAGVDVELRKNMWAHVKDLREAGVTIILTTHYIEEAEEMADRVGVINAGKVVVVEEKAKLMEKLGTKEMNIELTELPKDFPAVFADFNIEVVDSTIRYIYDPRRDDGKIEALFNLLHINGIRYRDINTKQSSLEDIFVRLVNES